MNRYFEHMHTKSPHERRQHAMRVAGVLTALVFVGWVSSLGVRSLGNAAGGSVQVAGTAAADITQSAAAQQAGYAGQNQLIVATTSDY